MDHQQPQQLDLANEAQTVALSEIHLGNLEQALAEFETALALFERAGSPSDVANCHSNVGVMNTALGRFAEAVAAFDRARDSFVDLNLGNRVASCDVNLCNTYCQLGHS